MRYMLFLLLLAIPSVAQACQCMEPTIESSMKLAEEADLVMEGTITALHTDASAVDPSRKAWADVAVERVGKGSEISAQIKMYYHAESMPMGDGAFMSDSCGLSYREGQKDIFVLDRLEDGSYSQGGFCAIILPEAWATLTAGKE